MSAHPYLSNSEIACYRRCPREHRYRYIERVETVIVPEAIARGKSIHAALAVLWNEGMPLSAPNEAWDAGLALVSPADRAMLRGYELSYSAVAVGLLPGAPLSNVRVNMPWKLDLGFATLVGELDAIGQDTEGKTVIVEHKTTSSDISQGSNYWRHVVTENTQASAYSLAVPGATILWDVLRKPQLRKLEANGRRSVPETDEEFETRSLVALMKEPSKYFARTLVVRLERELNEFVEDVEGWSQAIHHQVEAPRNPDACHEFGRPCDFWGVCWGGDTLDSPQYRRVERNHTETVAMRVMP